MAKMIQIRNVPDDVHRTMKSRAAAAGMSLSDYLRADLERRAALPPFVEWLQDTGPVARRAVDGEDVVAAIRELRGA